MKYLKAIATESEGILHVLGAPFYGPERGADSDGQFFDPDTDFMDDAGVTPPVFYWHGSRTNSLPFQIADVTKTWMTDEGRWYEVSLYTDSQQLANNVLKMGKSVVDDIMGTIRDLWTSAKNGTLFASTGAVPASVIIEESGRIAQWLVGELSLIDANLDEGRVPANFYASAIPVKLDTTAFEKLRSDSFEFENLTIEIPGGTVPASNPNQLDQRVEADETLSPSPSLAKSMSKVLSDRFSRTLEMDEDGDDEISDVIMDVIEDGLGGIAQDNLATEISQNILNTLSEKTPNNSFDENFISRAFEQAFLEVFQTFRRGTMPKEDVKTTTPETPPAHDPAIAEQLEAMKVEMEAMKSSNEALTAQLRQTEATAATAQSETFLSQLVQDGKLVAAEVESWMPVMAEAFSIDTAIKSGGGEGKMLELIMTAMKSRPQASILGEDSDTGDLADPNTEAPIKSGKVMSTSQGITVTGGPDHSKVDASTLNDMRRYVGIAPQTPPIIKIPSKAYPA